MIIRIVFLFLCIQPMPGFGQDIGNFDLVDLSHPYNNETLYWPTSPSSFDHQQLDYGMTDLGFFYSSYSICTPEHGGTHLDAPIHFSADGQTAEQIPLNKLIAPGIVIDISDKTANDRNYRLTQEDVLFFETEHGQIEPGTIVLLRTGWDKFWPDAMAYLGDNTPGDASHLQFPSYGEDAARLLVEGRQVALLGIDTASIDYGQSKDFIVHRIASARNVGGLENLRFLDRLPPRNFTVIALPMKIDGGSGGPVRVVAMIPKQ